MDDETAPVDVSGAAAAAARTLSHLHALLCAWAGAPEQVHYLRDDVERFAGLLDSVRQNGRQNEQQPATTMTTMTTTTTTAVGPDDTVLIREVALARRTLEDIEAVLSDLLSEDKRSGRSSAASAVTAAEADVEAAARSLDARRRHRWVLRRDDIARSQRGLQLSCQQILSRLVTMNLSLTTDVSATVHRHERLLKDIHKLLMGPEDKFDATTSRTLLSQNHRRINLNHSNNDTAPSSSTLRYPAPDPTEVRTVHNEQRFQHLEQVFTTMTRRTDAGWRTDRPPHGGLASLRRCEGLCYCRCHRHLRRFRDFRLVAFTNSLGAFSFSLWGPFTPTCDLATCTSPRLRWVKATYTFPAWLLRATVSATSSYAAPSPELVLRVCRRIPNDNASLHDRTLYSCVVRGDVDGARRLLLRREAAVTDVKDYGGETILHTALDYMSRLGDFSMVRLLVQEGADWFHGKDNGHFAGLQAFEYIFSNPDASESSKTELISLVPLDRIVESARLSDLHKIVLGIRHIDIREFLLLRPCDVNVRDIMYYSPLCYAAAKGDLYTLEALLEAGAETEFPHGDISARPLHLACQNVRPEIVKTLLRAGAHVNSKSWLRRTPLMWLARSQVKRASESDLLTIAHDLMQAGADISHEDEEKWSAINHAADFNHAGLIEYLLALGPGLGGAPNIDHQDQEGSTPVMTAIVQDAREAATVLLRRGADLNAVDTKGWSVLHYVASFAGAETMAFFVMLAEVGALKAGVVDVTRENSEGLTPRQALERRANASLELRDCFSRLLALLADLADGSVVGEDRRVEAEEETEEETEEEEEDEFFDAVDNYQSLMV